MQFKCFYHHLRKEAFLVKRPELPCLLLKTSQLSCIPIWSRKSLGLRKGEKIRKIVVMSEEARREGGMEEEGKKKRKEGGKERGRKEEAYKLDILYTVQILGANSI